MYIKTLKGSKGSLDRLRSWLALFLVGELLSDIYGTNKYNL